MKRFSQNGWGIQLSPNRTKSRTAILALIFLPLITQAIVDKNSDGISDVWEQQYNSGQLFDPPLDPAADADHDGWTNAQEAASGTNPFDSNPPAGFLRPEVINIPGVWGDPDANGDPVPISPNALRVSWQTIPGKQYTLLYSPDLTASSWLPVEEAFIGTGFITEYNFPLTQPTSTFWRVKIEDADSDGDALTDAEEYVFATDAANPTTVSGIPDLWLAENFASVLMNSGFSAIDPNADPDGDGASNAEEASSGTDPNTSNPATDHDWVRVTGNGEMGVTVTRSGTLTIPAGESRTMVVVIASDEFPNYTGTPSEFNDLLGWNATPSQGASIQDSIEVNDRHSAWESAITNETSLSGFPSPVHIEEARFLTAPPNSALTIQVQVSATNVSDGALPSHVAVGLLPIEMDFIMPDSESWEDVMPDNRVIMHDENTRIRVNIQGISLYAADMNQTGLEGLYLKTSLSRLGLPEVLLPFLDRNCTVIPKPNRTEIRYELTKFDLMSLSLLPSSEESDPSIYSALDYSKSGTPSNFLDSQAFLDRMRDGLQGVPAGYANNKPDVDLSSTPPQSSPDKTFMQAAGAEVLSARIGSVSKLGLVMNQGEIFYFSGHGMPGDYSTGPTFSISDEKIATGADLNLYWHEELYIAVISGCSAVNINNWYPTDPTFVAGTVGPNAGYYPGKFMNTIGPRYIFGYGSSAPTDEQNSDEIITEFIDTYLGNRSDPFAAWRQANDNPNGRNATAIEKNTQFGYFEKVTLLGVTIDYIWTTKNHNEW